MDCSASGPAGFSSNSSWYSGLAWRFQYSVISFISALVTRAPCTRSSLLLPMGLNSMSPMPSRLSAPPWSRMMRLSVWELTAKAMRDGMLVLIMPVTTSTDGRCVATTRWMPQLRPSWPRRMMESSTSDGATIMRSASSSTITIVYGMASSPTRALFLFSWRMFWQPLRESTS